MVEFIRLASKSSFTETRKGDYRPEIRRFGEEAM